MTDTYRTYNDFVPEYLRGRPRQIIVPWKSSSRKYTEEDILTEDTTQGIFTLQGNGKVYTINFGCIRHPYMYVLRLAKVPSPCNFFCIIIISNKKRVGMGSSSWDVQTKLALTVLRTHQIYLIYISEQINLALTTGQRMRPAQRLKLLWQI